MVVNPLAVPGIELVTVLQTGEDVRLTAEGMLDAFEPSPIQGDQMRRRLMQVPFFRAALYRFIPTGFI